MVKLECPAELTADFIRHDEFINGYTNWRAEIKEGTSDMIKITEDNGMIKVLIFRLI